MLACSPLMAMFSRSRGLGHMKVPSPNLVQPMVSEACAGSGTGAAVIVSSGTSLALSLHELYQGKFAPALARIEALSDRVLKFDELIHRASASAARASTRAVREIPSPRSFASESSRV